MGILLWPPVVFGEGGVLMSGTSRNTSSQEAAVSQAKKQLISAVSPELQEQQQQQASSAAVKEFVGKIVQDAYPATIREIVDTMRLRLKLDLPAIHIEQWVQNAALSAFEQIPIKKAIQDATDKGVDEAYKAIEEKTAQDEIPGRIYKKVLEVLHQPEIQTIFEQKAREFIEPIIGPQKLQNP